MERRCTLDTAKLFEYGNAQAVRLPEEYRFEGSQVYIRKLGSADILIPYETPWQILEESLAMFSDDFLDNNGPLRPQERPDVFK